MRSSNKIYFTVFTIFLFFLAIPAFAEITITHDQLIDKSRGMWVGQIIGNYAGRSTEGSFSGSTENPAESVPWILKQNWDADDDTDIEYIAMHILETHGFDCNSVELANQWLEHISYSRIYIANRQARFLMEDGVLPPLTGSRNYNMNWYSIDSQITTEVLGAVCPGLTQQSINLSGEFARISNEGFPVHAAQFYAAMFSAAFFESEIETLIENGLDAIPQSSRTHQVITDVKNWYLQDISDGSADWRETRRKIYDHYQGSLSNYRYYNWVESTVNTASTVLCLLYGGGDFKQTVQIGVLAGWDCDCNPATAGAIIGVINGFSGLPSDLTDPNLCGDQYVNHYRPKLPDHNAGLPQYDTITNIASRIANLAEQNIIQNGGYITYSPEKTLHIPAFTGQLTTDPEKPDPNKPSGLAAKALDAGINVTLNASVERYYSLNDRTNLNAIVDGIKDNSYNGHKPYYTYQSDPALIPEKDFYQINFDSQVIFNSITFYEGDIDWSGINNYVRDDNLDGGYFEDITVEVLKDGNFITPSNLQQSEPLDKYKMYQEITFTFDSIAGTAIRIIGTAGGTKRFTTIMELEPDGELSSDISQLMDLASLWLSPPSQTVPDINGDGIINMVEFANMASNWLSASN